MQEFVDIVTISQMTPGPIAINSATFVGTRIAGLPGAIIATIGCVYPSCIIVLTLAWVYYRYRTCRWCRACGGLRPAVVAMIASAGISILVTALWNGAAASLNPADLDWIAALLFVAALFVLRKWKLNPSGYMVGTGVVGLGLYIIIWVLNLFFNGRTAGNFAVRPFCASLFFCFMLYSSIKRKGEHFYDNQVVFFACCYRLSCC